MFESWILPVLIAAPVATLLTLIACRFLGDQNWDLALPLLASIVVAIFVSRTQAHFLPEEDIANGIEVLMAIYRVFIMSVVSTITVVVVHGQWYRVRP